MKFASDFRQIARNALRGNWGIAVLTGFVATLIGANIATGGGADFDSSNSTSTNTPENLITSEPMELILPVLLFLSFVLVGWAIATTIVGGAGKLGYAKFNLNLIDKKRASFSDLFSQFNRLGTGFCMNLLVSLYTILWTLLFIIPGIVKAYSYSMTPYILAEHPEMTVNQAITKSREVMNGNKWRLFCLEFSFIGWDLLNTSPALLFAPLVFMDFGAVGIVLYILLALSSVFAISLFLTPYKEAAHAAFYREVSFVYFPQAEIED